MRVPSGAALRLEMTGSRTALHAHQCYHLDVMEAAIVQTLLAAAADAPLPKTATIDLVPISPWSALDGRCVPRKSVRLPGGGRALPMFVAGVAVVAVSCSMQMPSTRSFACAFTLPKAGPWSHRDHLQTGCQFAVSSARTGRSF